MEYDNEKDYKVTELVNIVVKEHLGITDEKAARGAVNGIIYSFVQA